jgi:predicted transcriptional regulator
VADQDSQPEDLDWERLARAETHPLRISIFEVLAMDGGRTLAPNELRYELRAPLATINYHVTELRKAALIRLAHEQQVGGTMEHFYCLFDHSAEDLFRRLRLPPETT